MAASSSSALVPSSSISSLDSSYKYQVFLSFRGIDTRQGFTWNLYNSLKEAGIETFMDEKDIEAGEEIDKRLFKAIEDSRYCVAILSSRYAESKACLMELAAMFRLNKEIIPVFFYVDPSDVRHQSGPFEIDFSTHKKRPFEIAFSTHQMHSKSSRDVEEWRQAMTKVGQLKGFHLSHESSKKEADWIQEIVERVGGCRDNVNFPVAEHPVGIDSRVEEVLELLSIGEGGVQMVGIYGMGGIGKTTFAKAIRNRLQHRFEKAIYIEGIKDKKDRLHKVQKEFISKAFKEGNKKIHNPTEGSAEIKRRFSGKRVFAVLDDVDDGDQLKALAGGCDWFGEGTRILITTRDEQLLDAHPVHKKYQVHELNSRESLHLFSRHAFKSDQPSEEFMEISKKIVNATGGLPLALEVLGASLSTETQKEAWEEVETKLRNSKYSKIDKCLRISYDGLSLSEQEGFLDIACFFLGEEKDNVIDIWTGCDFGDPVSTIKSLSHKCLVKVDYWGNLYMHDLLRDMGRVIGSSSRLWDQKKVWEVLKEHKGTNEIKGIICKGSMKREERASVDVEAFANMSNLKLLVLEVIDLEGDFSRMPRSLRSLEWTGCSMQMLPDNFNIEKLGCLKLRWGNIVQFWSDSCISKKKAFANLNVLHLCRCHALTKLPDFSHSLALEKLYIQECSSLRDIPESIGKLTGLRRLDLSFCNFLSTLPHSIGWLTLLEELGLYECTSLSTLPDSIGSLTKLRRLDLSYCQSLSALPDSIGNLTLLEVLILYKCTSLSTLPDSIGSLTKLRRLDLSSCESLLALPSSIGRLTLLELEIRNCTSLSVLPSSIGRLTLLEQLTLGSCTSLSTLPDSIGSLTKLRRLYLYEYSSLSALPDSIGNLTLLEELQLRCCRSLSTLPDSIGNLTRLRELHLSFCISLSALPSSIGRLTLLEELTLYECTSLSTLPDSIGNLTELRRLYLSKCESLSALPNSIGNLTLLEKLQLWSCTSLSTLPDSIGNLTGLRRLYLFSCKSLLALPDSIGNLTLLEDLQLIYCTSLSTLPFSIGNMRRLSTLILSKSGIEELPDSVRFLESLEWLNIGRCRLRSRLPLSEMKCLKGLVMEGEVNHKDEIPYWIIHYSRHTQECRRIRYIQDWARPVSTEPCIVYELSIWVVSGRERKIILVVHPSRKRDEERLYWNVPLLKHIFPDDFTPLYDMEALDAYASSSPAPDISQEQLEDFYKRIYMLTWREY